MNTVFNAALETFEIFYFLFEKTTPKSKLLQQSCLQFIIFFWSYTVEFCISSKAPLWCSLLAIAFFLIQSSTFISFLQYIQLISQDHIQTNYVTFALCKEKQLIMNLEELQQYLTILYICKCIFNLKNLLHILQALCKKF